MQKIKHIIQTDVVSSLVAATCGVSLQEVISSTASLLHTILKSSNWQDVEMSITPVLSSYQFKLGDECRSVVLEIFKRCTEGTYPASNFGDLIFELWDSIRQTILKPLQADNWFKISSRNTKPKEVKNFKCTLTSTQ
jgi:hypothetical protein